MNPEPSGAKPKPTAAVIEWAYVAPARDLCLAALRFQCAPSVKEPRALSADHASADFPRRVMSPIA
jgi:hypothetical protein